MDVVEDEVAEIAVDLGVRLPVAGVSFVLLFAVSDLIEAGQVVDRLKVHSESVLGPSPRDVTFELFQLLCGYL